MISVTRSITKGSGMSLPPENAAYVPRGHEWLPRANGHEMYTNDGTAYQHKGMIHPPTGNVRREGLAACVWRASIRGNDRPGNRLVPDDRYFNTADDARRWVEEQVSGLMSIDYQWVM